MGDPFLEDTTSPDRQINRRSMYRSPGTSSSPDLATLLRKAKEKGGTVSANHFKEKRRESPPPLPDRDPSTPLRKNKLQRSQLSPESPDWVMTSPRSSDGPSKPPRSVREKTSAFWGKIIGQSTLRERSKTDATSLSQAFVPPVPPLTSSPIADAFASSNRLSVSKPLPPVTDDRSRLSAGRPSSSRTPSPDTSGRISKASKRRSMSVTDADLKNIMSTSHPLPPTPDSTEEEEDTPRMGDTTLNGIITDFKGELTSLDNTVQTSFFDLRDPSTPSRRSAYARPKTDGHLLETRSVNTNIYTPPRRASLITPTLTLNQLDSPTIEPSSPSPIVPPRFSSLQNQTPSRNSLSTPSRYGSPTQLRNFNSFAPSSAGRTNQLRVSHRSSASNSEPSLIPIGDDTRFLSKTTSHQDLTTPSHESHDSNEDDETKGKRLAAKCWNEDETFLVKEKIAEWLGGTGQVNKISLRYYINNFDFSGLRLDMAFRHLCAKLFVKGETQQVDRIIEEFSRRYWECNTGGIFGSAHVVHAVTYSLLLLNTDLHVAELVSRMSRSQFVKNTLTALMPDDSDNSVKDSSDGGSTIATSPALLSKRSNSITSWHSISKELSSPSTPSSLAAPQHSDGSTPSIQASATAQYFSPIYGRQWESDMESLLKEMYNAIKSQQILQPLSSSRASMSGLSPGGPMLRNRSLRVQPDRLTTSLKRGSIRGLQSIMGSQANSPYSSNSSVDGRASPSPSFATSIHETLYGSSSSFMQPTLGFASNLSHTIIKEAQEDDDRSIKSANSTSTSISITDEELALLGAPWAKEGMLCRKQYWETTEKRAKDKRWLDVFVVIQHGELNMFVFGDNGNASSGVFGGGNWLSNARPVGTIQLAHSLAHPLPPPGYQKRSHCMVLTLATGGVYFFQAGTEELVNEWVSTCNYWAARTSKEPLAGGVSNMEYGWNRVSADDSVHNRSQSEADSALDYTDAFSMRSGRSSKSKFGWKDSGSSTVRAARSPWFDKLHINDWKPPAPPTVSSVHDEETQLDALLKHVQSMKKDLKKHNDLRKPMYDLFPPNFKGLEKAKNNWEKKSQYLLAEIVKYDSYIESLEAAMSLRLKKRGEKALERALNVGGNTEEAPSKWKGPDEETIHEDDEPITPSPSQFPRMGGEHRRETAEDDASEESVA